MITRKIYTIIPLAAITILKGESREVYLYFIS